MKKGLDTKYFQKFQFGEEQINKYWKNALKDLEIAKKDSIVDVKFSYSYSALLKAGIALLAKKGGMKIRGVPGHHIKLLEKFSEFLGNPQIEIIGNAMRAKRNTDLYGGGINITEKEAQDFLTFVMNIIEKTKKEIF